MQLEGREPLLLSKVNRPTMILTGRNYLHKNRLRGISYSAHEGLCWRSQASSVLLRQREESLTQCRTISYGPPLVKRPKPDLAFDFLLGFG